MQKDNLQNYVRISVKLICHQDIILSLLHKKNRIRIQRKGFVDYFAKPQQDIYLHKVSNKKLKISTKTGYEKINFWCHFRNLFWLQDKYFYRSYLNRMESKKSLGWSHIFANHCKIKFQTKYWNLITKAREVEILFW